MSHSPYQRVVDDVEHTIRREAPATEPTVTAYMVARAALLEVRAKHGAHRAAELAYKLADEFAGESGR